MKAKILKIIVCPDCKSKLTANFKVFQAQEIISGDLYCQNCKSTYRIIQGLPVMLGKSFVDNHTKMSFETEWALYYKGKFEVKDLYGKSEKEELLDFIKLLDIDTNSYDKKRILDAGCGSGRLTRNIAKKFKNFDVFGIDIGQSVILANQNCKLNNIHIIQADIDFLPFPEHSFDYIWSEGVIHHTKNPRNSFNELSRLLKKGGKIYIWVYPNYLLTPYLIYRKLFSKSYLLSTKELYLLSWFLSIPTYIIYRLAFFFGLFIHNYKIKSLVFKIYDCLTPEYQYYFSKKEVFGWFKNNNYKNIEIKGDLGVTGVKT